MHKPITEQNFWYLEGKEYWMTFRPKMSAKLIQQGTFHATLVKAVENARDVFFAMTRGQLISVPEARTEAMSQFIFLPPEEEALEEMEKW